MFKIILILVLTKNIRVSGNDESFGKFIDLLPEEEKEEFLDRIARRILASVNKDTTNDNNNSNKPDVEANDEQLDAHDGYVKDILREETKRYENDKRQDESEKNGEGDGDNGDENKYIDLTLRDGKVLKINDEEEQRTTSEIPYNVIPVKTVYDDVNDDPSQTSSKKLEEGEPMNSKFESDNLSNTSLNVNVEDNLRKSFQNELNNVSTKEESSSDKENTLSPTENREIERNSNEFATGSNHNTKENNDLNKHKNSDISFEDSTISDKPTTMSEIQSSLHSEEDKYESTTLTINDTEISTKNNLNDFTEHFQKSGDIQNLTIDVVSTTDINKANTNLVKVTETEKDTGNVSLTSPSNKSDEKIQKDLPLRSGVNNSEQEISVKKPDIERERRGKEYEVFEVAPDKSPFKLINKVKTNKPPRYVPIYDYASENAYFQPYDKFGPRGVEHEKLKRYDIIEEKDENEFDAKIYSRNRFSPYNNDEGDTDRHGLKYNYPIHTDNTNMYGFMKPVQTHFMSNLNPYDYLDMDYINNGRYILRNLKESGKTLPHSDESDHPFNSIHKGDSAKDHVRAVRQLLYLQKRFGYIPEIEKQLRKSDGKVKKSIPIINNNEKFMDYEEKISLDYYYDRDDDERKGFGDIELRKVPSKVKIIVPVHSKEVLEDYDEVSDALDEKYFLNSVSTEHINNLVQIEADEKGFCSFFDAILEVLKDKIKLNDEGLEDYDWLRSAVDIQSAIWRLLDLTESLKYGEEIHPKDIELLKYCLYLYKSSRSLQKYDKLNVNKRERKGFLPKNRKKKKTKHPLVFWKDFAKYIRNIDSEYEQNLGLLIEFEDFLKRVLISLNDLHDAIKHIAIVTKFDTQNWFNDLKEVYLKKANKQEIGAVLLHFSVLALVENLEDDADTISKMNFKLFVEYNRENVEATRKEFMFVSRVLGELDRINV